MLQELVDVPIRGVVFFLIVGILGREDAGDDHGSDEKQKNNKAYYKYFEHFAALLIR